MKRKVFYSFFALILCNYISAQVGVGTTNPDPSSMLDITATDKGVLVPRVNLNDVTDATAPINAPAIGLLVWNTNAAVVGGSGTGFYFFNGVQWMPLMQLATDDADFYEEGTTAAPDNIADDMFTQGYVAIGKNTADHRLELNEIDNAATRTLSINSSANTAAQRLGIYNEMNVSGAGEARGMYNLISGADDGAAIGTYSLINRTGNGQHIGSYNFMDGDGFGIKYGTFNRMTGDNGFQYGTYNLVFSNTMGWRVGTYNSIGGGPTTNAVYGTYNALNTNAGSGQTGVRNSLTTTGNGQSGVVNFLRNNGVNDQRGILNDLGGSSDGAMVGVDTRFDQFLTGVGDKIGTRVVVQDYIAGTHYGFYSDVTKAGSYAAYLLGDVSIGTDGTDNYILPDSRGTNGQIMQTDGAGNVDWVNPGSSSSLVRVNLGANQNLNTTGWQKALFNTVVFDTQTEFDLANNRFVAANDGFYQINAGYHTAFQSNTQYYGIGVYVNGALYQEYSVNHHGVGDVQRNITCVVSLNANDFVEIYIQNFQAPDGTNGNAVNLDSFSGKTYFEVIRLR